MSSLMGIYGNVGCGKGVLATRQAVKAISVNSEIDILTNFKMNLQQARPLDITDLIDMLESPVTPDTKEKLIIGDELYTLIESRLSGSALNRFMSLLPFQRRKRKVKIVAIAQLKSSLDLRYRYLEDLTVFGHDRPHKIAGKINTADFEYTLIKNFYSVDFTLKYGTAQKLFPLYDTAEVILPADILDLKAQVISQYPEKLDMQINRIIEKFELRKFDLTKITHNIVKDNLIKIRESLLYEPYVYVRLISQIERGND